MKALVPSPNETHHCYCTFGVATCWLYQYWDNDGVGSTPKHLNLLVFCDHFTKHVVVYVTPDQIVKTVAKFLWQGYILIFRALAKLLSDGGANFESNTIRKLCELMGVWKVRTSPDHAQTNGQVEWAYKMLMHIIGKLSKDWKPESIYPNWCMLTTLRSAITRYSLHYFMFRHQPCLPINFYFPMIRHIRNTRVLITTSLSYVNSCRKQLKRLRCSPHQMQRDRSYRKANAISLESGDLVLAKASAYRGRNKVKDHWEEEPYRLEFQVAECIPSYLMRNQWAGHSWVLHWNWPFLIVPTEGTPLCMVMCAKQARYTTTTLDEQPLEDNETEEVPQCVNCPSLAQHQTGKTPLGWVNRKLHAFIGMFSRASLLDKGWKVWCRGIRGVWTSMSAFWRRRYWSH